MTKAVTPWEQLAEPFPADEVKQRPGRGGMTFSYVDARAVMQRLDDVLTPEGWSFEVKHITEGIAHGRLSVYVGDRTIVREDYGYRNGPDDEEPLKSASSDALKRCAVHVGVGRHLYTDSHAGGSRPVQQQSVAQRPPSAPTGDGTWQCPEHGDERIGSGRNGLYCQVRGGQNVNAKGYCNYNESNASPPAAVQPRPQTNEGLNQLPGVPSEPADLQASFDSLPF